MMAIAPRCSFAVTVICICIPLTALANMMSPESIEHSLADARILQDNGAYETAIEALLQVAAVQCSNSVEQSAPLCISLLESLGQLYERSGDYYEAISMNMHSLNLSHWLCSTDTSEEVANIIGDKAHTDHHTRAPAACTVEARHRANLGRLFMNIGEYAEARSSLEAALSFVQSEGMRDKLPRVLQHYGVLQAELGRFDEGVQYLEDALEGFRRTGDRQGEMTCLKDLGKIYERRDGLVEQTRAPERKRSEHALSAFEERMSKGCSAASKAVSSDALLAFSKSLEIANEVGDDYEIVLSFFEIASAYLYTGQLCRAENALAEAKRKDTDGRLLRTPRWERAELYLKTKQYATLQDYLRSIPAIWLLLPVDRARFHALKGAALHGTGEARAAMEEFLVSIAITERERKRAAESDRPYFLQGGTSDKLFPYKALVEIMLDRATRGDRIDPFLYPYGVDLNAAAWFFSEQMKARSFNEAVERRSSEERRNSESKETYSPQKRFAHVLYDPLERKIIELATTSSELRPNTVAIEQIDRQIGIHLADYDKFKRQLTLDKLPLAQSEVLLEFVIGNETCHLFMIKQGGIRKVMKISMEPAQLVKKVEAFLQPMRDRKYWEFSRSSANSLFQHLLAEALRDVAPGERLAIVPDGILSSLPFEMLVTTEPEPGKPERFLGENYDIVYYSSGAQLASSRLSDKPPARKTLLAVANPVLNADDPRSRLNAGAEVDEPPLKHVVIPKLDTCPYGLKGRFEGGELTLCPLPDTEAEVQAISTALGAEAKAVNILSGVTASETNLRHAQVQDYQFIHFATHADIPGAVLGMSEPFILLSQVGNEGLDDGFLTLSEVTDFNINADLVVLSACNTGRGELIEGEGVINFARAFAQAGARGIVVSLWEASSQHAVTFMTRFYSVLRSRASADEAIRAARVEVMQHDRNPFFWAGFVLYGGR